ncbi:MAG: hypothetical protein PHD60_11795 [Clostridia bacterium]|nr:hypothetical protein [Clostridia bacterium]
MRANPHEYNIIREMEKLANNSTKVSDRLMVISELYKLIEDLIGPYEEENLKQ